MNVPKIKLNDGNFIPQIGLGTWQSKDAAQFQTAFDAAIKTGYRHFDTAQAYGNEQFLGDAWRKSGLKREDLFITTKIAVQHFGEAKAKDTFAESLQRLQTDYVDLLLLHFPVTLLRKNTWKAAEAIKALGQAKSIGVSNYTIRHLKEMNDYAETKPSINQVELHVFLQQPELIKYCKDNDIAVEAYSPLARQHVTDDPVIQEIAVKHGKTYSQIMLRWLIEQDMVVIPKSVTPSRIAENFGILEFELTQDEMTQIQSLDRDMRVCWSPVHVP